MKKELIKNAFIASTVALVLLLPGGSAVFAYNESGHVLGCIGTYNTRVDLLEELFIVNINETFTIPVYVYPAEDIIGVEFGALYYNASLIHANSVNEGDLFDPYNTSFNAGIIDNVAGAITNVSGFTDPVNPVNEPGYFCNINFTAQQDLGISALDLEDVIVTNMTGDPANITVVGGDVVVVWYVTLDFSEPNGETSYVIFGEAEDANDGPPSDRYDEGLPPAPFPPYIRAWFDDDLPGAYDKLQKDFRKYPDVRKVWNLSVKWENYSSVPPSITISWDIDEVENCEYNYMVLRKKVANIWYSVADMLTENNYIYMPQYYFNMWWTDYFQITAGIDIFPPEIIDVTVAHSYPKDTDPTYGWENFTCRVTDDAEVDTVQLNLTYPDLHTEHITMNKSGDAYYYNVTLTNPGGENTPGYNYHIYATDLFGRMNISTPQLFKLPMNIDVDEDGTVGFVDIMMVAGLWTATGPNGWIRADVDNNGEVGFVDIMMVAGMWNAQW